MTIDFHAHPVPDAFRKWLPLLNIDVIADDGFPLPQWNREMHLQFMDDAGIDYTVLSLPTPHIHNGDKVILMKKKHFDENTRWLGIREQIYSGNGLVQGD